MDCEVLADTKAALAHFSVSKCWLVHFYLVIYIEFVFFFFSLYVRQIETVLGRGCKEHVKFSVVFFSWFICSSITVILRASI